MRRTRIHRTKLPTGRVKAAALHSHHSELVRRIRSAQRQHTEAREAARKYAKLLWLYRSSGIKPKPDSAIVQNYSNARSRMANASRLLLFMQAKYKRLHGRKWQLRRRNLRTGELVGDRYPEGVL